VILIDEQIGRTIALSRNLPVSGTLGILERADTIGLIRDFPGVIGQLKTAGFHVAESLEQILLQRHRARRANNR
jgi:predicted nucleic acid-binding protein